MDNSVKHMGGGCSKLTKSLSSRVYLKHFIWNIDKKYLLIFINYIPYLVSLIHFSAIIQDVIYLKCLIFNCL